MNTNTLCMLKIKIDINKIYICMNSDILHGFKSCTQYLISLCTICHACYFALHIYKSLALCLNCF